MIETNRIHHTNCLEGLPKLESHTVSAIHTSPPYNIGRDYNGYNDSLEKREYLEFISSVVDEMYRVLRPGGSLFWQTGYTSFDDNFIYPIDHLTFHCFTNAGFKLKDRIIWRYFGGMSFKQKFTNKHETILWWVKPGAECHFDVFPIRERSRELDPRNNLFGRNPGNVWEVDRVAYGSLEQTSHIAVFPEEVSDRIVSSATCAGDLCLDPFSGSGTLCKVAKTRGREFVGFEIADQYYADSVKRLSLVPTGEYRNVLSALVKLNAFVGNGKSLTLLKLHAHIDLLLRNLGLDKVGLFESPDEIEWIRTKTDSFSKARKVSFWRSTDDFFESPKNAGHPLYVLNQCLEYAFKLTRVQNGVMRLHKILEWHDQYMSRKDALADDLKAIFSEEKESFVRSGSRITLRNKFREVRTSPRKTASKKSSQTSFIS
ncbi:MAG: DNA methyltransferase [Candidatus Zixiibacteriota bacterium]